jgi:hypothetical protein
MRAQWEEREMGNFILYVWRCKSQQDAPFLTLDVWIYKAYIVNWTHIKMASDSRSLDIAFELMK